MSLLLGQQLFSTNHLSFPGKLFPYQHNVLVTAGVKLNPFVLGTLTCLQEPAHFGEILFEALWQHQLRVCGARQHVGLQVHSPDPGGALAWTTLVAGAAGWLIFAVLAKVPMVTSSDQGQYDAHCYGNYYTIIFCTRV